MSKCPECNTKLRKFNGGFICQKNHKYLPGSKVYNQILSLQVDTKLNKKLCPECQTECISMCMCINSELRCINYHVWTSKYYQGDKRYLCVDPPNDNQHVFNFSL